MLCESAIDCELMAIQRRVSARAASTTSTAVPSLRRADSHGGRGVPGLCRRWSHGCCAAINRADLYHDHHYNDSGRGLDHDYDHGLAIDDHDDDHAAVNHDDNDASDRQ